MPGGHEEGDLRWRGPCPLRGHEHVKLDEGWGDDAHLGVQWVEAEVDAAQGGHGGQLLHGHIHDLVLFQVDGLQRWQGGELLREVVELVPGQVDGLEVLQGADLTGEAVQKVPFQVEFSELTERGHELAGEGLEFIVGQSDELDLVRDIPQDLVDADGEGNELALG